MPRGRVRDEDATRRILDAAYELTRTQGPGTVRIDDIADAAGVGKQTIYRWWPSRTAVVLDALVERTMQDTPFPHTADARADFRAHLRSVARLFSSPTGGVIRELLGEAQTSAEIAEDFRARFWQPRRDLSSARLHAAIDAGEVRADVAVEAALDALYGPLWLRLLIGHGPISPKLVDQTLDAVWRGFAPGPDTP